MEASGNEYVAQLLDRAANLIQDLESETSGAEDQGSEAKAWLQEYHQEKARFGQPLGSPGYAAAAKDYRAAHPDTVDGTGNADLPGSNQARHRGAPDADTRLTGEGGEGGDTLDYENATLTELQDAARRRGLPSSGTKADIRERLEDDDRDANAEG
jgi:hypothetical protein